MDNGQSYEENAIVTKSLNNDSNQNIIVPHLNCNQILTPLQTKHESKLTLNPIAIVIANASLSGALNC